MKNLNTRKLVFAALLAAMTFIATMIIKIPTPTMGYVHLGDGFVLLCGLLMGPLVGAFAAGIGSMFADLFSGYAVWAPATLIIKALTAAIAGGLFRAIARKKGWRVKYVALVTGGVIGEAVMVIGYFVFEAGLAAFGGGGISRAAIAAGIASSATGIPFNIAQGVVGIIVCALLLPILEKIPGMRTVTE